MTCVFHNVQLLYRSGTAVSRNRIEPCGAHGDHLDAIAGFNRCDGITGVDRTNESVFRLDADNVGYLGNIQQRSNARHKVLTRGTGSRQNVAIAFAQFHNQGTEVLTQEVAINCVVCNQYLCNAFSLGCSFSNGTAVFTSNQYIDIAADGFGSRYNTQGGLLQAAVVVFSNYKDAHQITFASFFSLSTSSATSATLTPA